MRRQLSARSTPFFKYVLPTLWGLLIVQVLFSAVYALVTHSSLKGEPSPSVGIVMFLGGLVPLFCMVRPTAPWRRVSCDENALYVGTLRGEVRIPLSEIVRVQEVKGALLGSGERGGRGWKPLLVELRTPSPIGQQFQFLPIGQPQGKPPRPFPWERGPHPVWIKPQASEPQ